MPKNIDVHENKRIYNCQFELTLDVIGGKWKPIILYYIGENEVIRFGDLNRCIPSINERMLTRQLRELERDGLIHREIYKQVPPRVEYSLTDLGKSVMPILYQLKDWGGEYNKIMNIAEFNVCSFDDASID